MDSTLKRTTSKIQLHERSDGNWLITIYNKNYDASVISASKDRNQALLLALAAIEIEVEIVGKDYFYNNFEPKGE